MRSSTTHVCVPGDNFFSLGPFPKGFYLNSCNLQLYLSDLYTILVRVAISHSRIVTLDEMEFLERITDDLNFQVYFPNTVDLDIPLNFTCVSTHYLNVQVSQTSGALSNIDAFLSCNSYRPRPRN